ncbi:MAG TPA: UDP-3-O-(3-hydroxymyristoyl)glucosamine N-acyltransferase [Deltaproteobacteria bacterium]|nr:UDP-3-O-(3-hydroxymyristoyl)glucosamine N-acyltransferase [Deltaproteobacteria bacterium]
MGDPAPPPDGATSQPLTTGRLAALVGAICEGDPQRVIHGVAALDRAGPSELSFCRGGRWARALPQTRAGAVLVAELDPPEGVVALRHPDPRYAYAVAAAALVPLIWPEPALHPSAWIAEDAVVEGATIDALAVVEAGAVVAPGAWVQAHAYVGRRAVIGAGCRLMPSSVVMEGCWLGERVWLQPGAIVGADGFGHVLGPSGPLRVPQLGIAVLEDDVEIGANACVDRAALDETRVGRGSRLDNLVQVAHGVRIGAECMLAAFAGVAGGARLGDRVIMAGRTAVIDGIEVGSGAVFAGLASARRDVPPGRKIGGSPARAYRKWLRETAALKRLPELLQQVNRLERRVATLEDEDP